MSDFCWLHISDWHEGDPEHDREVLRSRLLEDIDTRERINRSLTNVDVVIFSGDIAFSGRSDQYKRVTRTLIKPLKQLLGQSIPFVIVPGNHDLDRRKLPNIPIEWRSQLSVVTPDRNRSMGLLLGDETKLPSLIAPFKDFYDFCGENDCQYDNGSLINATKIVKGDRSIGIVGINSALCCARHEMRMENSSAPSWDYGTLSIAEQQIRNAIRAVDDADLKMLVLHHPISWIHIDEQPIIDQLVSANFDLVLHGHEHLPRFSSVESNVADTKYIPAGAAYDRRLPADPRQTNSYSFGCLSTASKAGRLYHRRWFDERDCWDTDDRYWASGYTSFVIRPKKIVRENRPFNAVIQRQFNDYFSQRSARYAEITLVHEQVEISGKSYIEATVGYKQDLNPGPKDHFTFGTYANKRILESEIDEVRARAFEILLLKPELRKLEQDPRMPNKKIGTIEIGQDQTVVEYQYRLLECNDGLWYFSLRRFVEHIKINIRRAKGYQYEYLSIGGFPALSPDKDGLLKYETLESVGGHLPYQGLIVQWYKKEG